MEVGDVVATTVVSDVEPGIYEIVFELINRDNVSIVNRNVEEDCRSCLVVLNLHVMEKNLTFSALPNSAF